MPRRLGEAAPPPMVDKQGGGGGGGGKKKRRKKKDEDKNDLTIQTKPEFGMPAPSFKGDPNAKPGKKKRKPGGFGMPDVNFK